MKYNKEVHKNNSIVHYQKRPEERGFGKISKEEIEEINEIIRKNDKSNCIFVRGQMLLRVTAAVLYKGEWKAIVYDRKLKTVVTVMPMEYLDNEQRKYFKRIIDYMKYKDATTKLGWDALPCKSW